MQDEGHFLRLPGSNLLTTSAVPRTSGLSRRRASDSSQGLFTRFRRGASPLPWHLPPLIRHLCRLLPSTPASSSSSSSNVLVPVSTVAVSDFPLAPGEDNEVRETGKWSTRYEIRQIGTFLKWTLAPSRIMSGSWYICFSHRCSISFRSLQKLTRTTILLRYSFLQFSTPLRLKPRMQQFPRPPRRLPPPLWLPLLLSLRYGSYAGKLYKAKGLL